jgi:hypothetical protein
VLDCRRGRHSVQIGKVGDRFDALERAQVDERVIGEDYLQAAVDEAAGERYRPEHVVATATPGQ